MGEVRRLPENDRMLLVLPVPVRVRDGVVLFEAQACNGVARWADNFESLIVAVPVIPESMITSDGSSVWLDVSEQAWHGRVEFVRLPWTFSYIEFIRRYSKTRALLGKRIAQSRYLQFAISGLAGDWAAVAAMEAYRQDRPYALHTDNVAHKLVVQIAQGHRVKRRVRAHLEAPIIKWYHERLVRRCSLGLWHGFDCYQAYSPYCENNHNIHDVHTKPADCISPAACEVKASKAVHDTTLRVCYAGRATGIKAPLDWVRAMAHARERGASIAATWLGDGPLLEEMRGLAKELGLGEALALPGFVDDRERLLCTLRESHVLTFTHLTPESPRCLLEALVSGTPIVGYDNAFARDLVEGHGGGHFVPIGDWKSLGAQLAKLALDREALAALIRDAGANGARFNDAAVFRERSALIKAHLP